MKIAALLVGSMVAFAIGSIAARTTQRKAAPAAADDGTLGMMPVASRADAIGPSTSRLRRAALLLGCSVLLPAAAPDGWQLYAAERYEEAVSAWTALAAQGNPDAMFGLGLSYDLGRGVEPNEGRACRYYRLGSEGGVVASTFSYAVSLDRGKCGGRAPAEVADWYGRAAAFGHSRAEYALGQLYEQGDGVPRNPDLAAAWYRAAATAGLTRATDHVATLASAAGQGRASTYEAPDPTFPAGQALPDRGIPTPFVWSAPAEPTPVRYFLEVFSLGHGPAAQVAAHYVSLSTAVVTLPPGAADYAWRVFAVAPESHLYVVSPWQRFTISERTAQ